MEMAKIEVGTEDKGPELLPETEEIGQGLDQASVLAQIGICQDAIGAMSMTTLLGNALMLFWVRNRMLLLQLLTPRGAGRIIKLFRSV